MTVRPLFADLVDDAGLFPPERLSMRAAVARHRADAAAGHAVLTHRFLCPTSQLAALRSQLDPDEDLGLGLIADTGLPALRDAVDDLAAASSLRLETVEIALPAAGAAEAAHALVPALAAVDAQAFVEIPRTPGWLEALELVAGAGLGAKVRCGGVRADLFPTRGELAAFIVAAVTLGAPCKATAGLHHAVRYRDPDTGFDHHGFLNLLVAVCRAVRHATAADVEAALAIADAGALADEAGATEDVVAVAARDVLVAYGSCRTSDPIADLVALDLVPLDPA